MNDTRLLVEIMEAHGGAERWERCLRVDATLWTGGLALASKGHAAALLDKRISVFPRDRRVLIHGFPERGQTGEWRPLRVGIASPDGDSVARDAPRRALLAPHAGYRWDRLDLLYFAGYALWNYLSFPWLLAQPGVEAVPVPVPVPATRPGRQTRLQVCFPEAIATHCRRQTFYLDAACRLVRHDYCAEVIGPWATAANYCRASVVVAGLRFYTRREVLPRLGSSVVLPLPTLVWIELQDIEVELRVRPVPSAALGARDNPGGSLPPSRSAR